jgi:DNA-binding PadR family transcriptional regulator
MPNAGKQMVEGPRDPQSGIGLAARVILHLFRLGRLGLNDVARAGYTQQGMVEELEVRQSTLVSVLKDLLAGEIISVERRFVERINRRVKVYTLTATGVSAARDLIVTSETLPESPTPSGWVSAHSQRETSTQSGNRR